MDIADQLEVHAKQELGHERLDPFAADRLFLQNANGYAEAGTQMSKKAKEMLRFDLDNENSNYSQLPAIAR